MNATLYRRVAVSVVGVAMAVTMPLSSVANPAAVRVEASDDVTDFPRSRVEASAGGANRVMIPMAFQSATSNVTAGAGQLPQTVNRMTNNPFAGARFWVDPNSSPVRAYSAARQSRPDEAALLQRLATQPSAVWFGAWNTDVTAAVRGTVTAARSAGALPVLVAYNIPNIDCSGGGGAGTADNYRRWIRAFAAGIGATGPAVVVVEPDALAQLDCIPAAERPTRVALLRDAVQVLTAIPGVAVYIDAGHPRWHSAEETANRLRQVGVEMARGFALNVSNYIGTAENIAYGRDIAQRLGGKHFVIDTSRNGLGPTADNQWCNAPGRALGPAATANTGDPLVDAFFWIKIPGESDGTCFGGPPAGTFWLDYALGLARRAQS